MKEEKRRSGKKWKRLSEERGWADVSYFSKIQRGCPVGSLPRPLLWNAPTHSRRVKRRDRKMDSKLARKWENMWHRNWVYVWHTYTGSEIHYAWLWFFLTVFFLGHILFLNFAPFLLVTPTVVVWTSMLVLIHIKSMASSFSLFSQATYRPWQLVRHPAKSKALWPWYPPHLNHTAIAMPDCCRTNSKCWQGIIINIVI